MKELGTAVGTPPSSTGHCGPVSAYLKFVCPTNVSVLVGSLAAQAATGVNKLVPHASICWPPLGCGALLDGGSSCGCGGKGMMFLPGTTTLAVVPPSMSWFARRVTAMSWRLANTP